MIPAINLLVVTILLAIGLPWAAVGFALGWLIFEAFHGQA